MGVDVSVVMTLHSEGLVVHRTFRALQAAIDLAGRQGLSVEIIAVLDKVSDPILKHTVEKWSSILEGIVSAHEVDFGALSLSRNFGISKSKGEFISILDGDDLYGEHWLLKAHQICSADRRTVAHPEVCYSFPLEPFLRYHFNGGRVSLELLSSNQWSALLMAHRDIFRKIPYIIDDQNFAYQDWLWNCETNAQGYRHVLVPETLMAIRQKPHGKSLWQNSHALNKVVRTNNLFKNFYLGKYNPDLHESAKPSSNFSWLKQLKGHIRHFIAPILVYPLDYLQVHHDSLFQQIVQFKRTVFNNFNYMVNKKAVPQWVKTELGELAKLEPNLKNFRKAQIRKKRPGNRLNHAITPQMATLIQETTSKVYILDGLQDDWETLGALDYLLCSDTKIFIVTTEKCSNRWLKFFSDQYVHIDIGNSNLFFEEKLILLHRLILESDAEYLHIFGSELGLEMVARYHGTFCNNKIFTSFFKSDFIVSEEDLIWKYRKYGELLSSLTCISTDTKIVRDYLLEVYGLSEDLVQHHHLPFTARNFTGIMDVDHYSHIAGQDTVRFQDQIRRLNLKLQSTRQDKKIEVKIAEMLNNAKISNKTYQKSHETVNGLKPGDGSYSLDIFTEQVTQFYNTNSVDT